MNIVCLDLEGVLVPEIWIAFAEASGIPELKRTTRDEPDYDKLMKYRLDILNQHGLGLKEIQETIATIDPMPGAKEFLDELRATTQAVILSDTFSQFAKPLMAKLGWPALFCNEMIVDEKDPAFQTPTKPIGPFYTEEEARELEASRGWTMKEDAGRGWRRVVASPIPKRIVEIDAVRQLWDRSIVITCGGGGIPVVERMDGHLEGVAAVIDKDFAAELLAEEVEADILMILTEVEKVAINYNTPEQEDLDHLTLMDAARYIEEGHLPAGSMLPKVEAAMKFVRRYPSKKAIITSLDKAVEALAGDTGTTITFN